MTGFPESLLSGYRSFRDGRFVRDRANYKALAELGQKPDAMVVACCDSRSAPETIFDVAPGEIFVVRNVANLVPPREQNGDCHSVSAAVEFAVRGLQVRHIVVLGHSGCGGIRAALHQMAEPLSPDDYIGKWMNRLQPAARAVSADEGLAAGERQTALEQISIRASIANLRTFPCVSNLEDKNLLTLHGAWFDIAHGELRTMNPATGEFCRAP